MSDFGDKLSDLENKHDEQVDQAIDKAGDAVDDRTGNKHSEQIDKGVEQLQKRD